MANKPGEANFFPDAPVYPEMGTFQPVYGKFDLTTYIQGASDYEIMAFLVGKYNACLEAYGTVTKLSTDTITAAHQLQDWVNSWFTNLDVQQELNNKIDSMVADGSFSALLHQTFDAQINQQTTNAVTSWLVANVTPTGSAVVVDKSLSIEGAAADAKTTGTAFNTTHNSISSLVKITTKEGNDIVLNKNSWTSGYINLNGLFVEDNNWKNSGYLDVSLLTGKNVSFYLASYNNVLSCSFFDINKKYISGSSADNVKTSLIIPDNAFYVVFCSSNDDSFALDAIYAAIPTITGSSGGGTPQDSYNEVETVYNSTVKLSKITTSLMSNVLVDKSTWQSGYIDLTGKFINDTNWKNSGYLDVSLLGGYSVVYQLATYNSVLSCSFFDINKKYIYGSSADNLKTSLTIPDNAFYVVFCSSNDASFALDTIYAAMPTLISKSSSKSSMSVIAIGDSYGVQNTDGDITKFYWEYIRDALGLTDNETFFKSYRAGAGFGNGGFLEMLKEAEKSIANKSAITDILICGGWNDSDKSQDYGTDEAFNKGVADFSAYVKANYNARITVAHIGWALYSDNAFYLKMNTSISRYINACNVNGWRYLTFSEYILRNRDNIWQSDGAHPNNDGEKILGENLSSTFLSGAYDNYQNFGNTIIGDIKITLNSDGTVSWTKIS